MAYKVDQALIVSGGRMAPGNMTVLRIRKVDGIDDASFIKLFDYKHFHILCSVPRAKPYKESVRIVVNEIKKLRNEAIIEPVSAERTIDLGLESRSTPKKARPKAKVRESMCIISIPARGDLPPIELKIVAPRKKHCAIEIEASQAAIQHIVAMVHYEIAKRPTGVRLESESSESSDERIDEEIGNDDDDDEGTIV